MILFDYYIYKYIYIRYKSKLYFFKKRISISLNINKIILLIFLNIFNNIITNLNKIKKCVTQEKKPRLI